ncbi:4-hydroxy-tetrahydrodipicolinate reductase [Rickettsiaceae bacterium]|nr:4-hydroxy-tetrahydrodipicolinate reductase [Rickettsiaceae bacterium]
MKTIKIALSGANGRMVQAIEKLMLNQPEKFELVGKIFRNSDLAGIDKICKAADVVIDFSSPDAIKSLTLAIEKTNAKLVIGTTALQDEHFAYLEELSKSSAVLYAPNTSIGANLVANLASKSAKILQKYDVEIIEAHHKHKKDAPSGTAIMIGEKIAEASGGKFDKRAVFDRANSGVRIDGEIGFSSIRGGGIFGENEVLFAGDNELVTIGCRALSRDAFAEGALYSAVWIFSQEPGLYSMSDVLQLDS